MLIYIIIFMSLILLSILNIYIDKSKLIKIYILFSIFLLIFTGFRYYLGGSDYYVYKEYFDSIPNIMKINKFEYFIEYEIGYKYLNSIIKTFTDNSIWLFFIITIITLPITLFVNYKYCKYPFFTLTFYMYKTFLYTNFVALRQSIAIVIFYIAIKYIIEGNFKKYTICIVVASLFHSSAIILILFYFTRYLNLENLKPIYILLIGIALMIISPLLIKFIAAMASSIGVSATIVTKINSITFIPDINLHVVEGLILYLIFSKYFKINNEFENIIYNLFMTYIVLLIAFSNQVIFIRISMYFYMIIMIFMSLSLSKIKNFRHRKWIICGLSFIFLVGYLKYLIQFDNGALIPYKTFLLK